MNKISKIMVTILLLVTFYTWINTKLYAQSTVLSYSTIIGGSGYDYGHAIAVDDKGYVYISGQANSSNYPTTNGAYDRSHNGGSDIFISKLNPDGSALVFSSYIGGSGRDNTGRVFVDSSGSVYLTGATESVNFPLTNNSLEGSSRKYFLKLNSTGSELEYSSRWAGGERILIDSEGNAVILGDTDSSTFPTTEHAYSNTHAGGYEIFVTKINTKTNTVIFSTYIGGRGNDRATNMILDNQNNIIITGRTNSEDFPAKGTQFASYDSGKSNVFVAKLESDGTDLIYSTIIGGDEDEWPFDITSDENYNIYITGATRSNNFPVSSLAFDTSYNSGDDAFLLKLNSDGSQLVYSSYIGGTSKDGGRGVVVDKTGRAYLTGCTKSTNFPTSSDAYDKTFNGAGPETWAWGDPFLLVMNPDGTQLEYSTYYGGSLDEEAYGIAMDKNRGVYICGITSSDNFPTTVGAYNRTLNGNVNIYVVKFQFPEEQPFIDYLGQNPPGDSAVIFAPGIINGYIHGKIAISPKGNEIYWVINPSTERIVFSKLENGVWTKPALADFVKDYLTLHNGGPVFSLDGEKIFFYSNRSGGIGGFDSWYVERTDSGWSNPINAGETYNSINDDPSPLFVKEDKAFRLGLAENNEPLCFNYFNDKFSNPAPVDIHPEYSPWWTIYISPEEDYLIFAGGTDNPDLYIRFKNERGQWGNPINMGNKINTNQWERFPFVSPDKKYLFFSRSISDTELIFWVSAGIIDSIKAALISTEEKSFGIHKSFKLNQNYPNPFNPSTTITYSLDKPSQIKLTIYNVLGQEIKVLGNVFQNAGEHSVVWNATDNKGSQVCSGVYFFQLETEKLSSQKKMILIQ